MTRFIKHFFFSLTIVFVRGMLSHSITIRPIVVPDLRAIRRYLKLILIKLLIIRKMLYIVKYLKYLTLFSNTEII